MAPAPLFEFELLLVPPSVANPLPLELPVPVALGVAVPEALAEVVLLDVLGWVAPHTYVFLHCAAQSLFPAPHPVMQSPCSLVQI
jgi:hypothetical protein